MGQLQQVPCVISLAFPCPVQGSLRRGVPVCACVVARMWLWKDQGTFWVPSSCCCCNACLFTGSLYVLLWIFSFEPVPPPGPCRCLAWDHIPPLPKKSLGVPNLSCVVGPVPICLLSVCIKAPWKWVFSTNAPSVLAFSCYVYRL